MRSILYHCHGLGELDFSESSASDLDAMNQLAADRSVGLVPTIFLRHRRMGVTADLIRAYGIARQRWPSILGFGIEGPLLGPLGGVPSESKWLPTREEWLMLASLGKFGLVYLVLAPDAMELDEEIESGFTFADLLVALYDSGVRIAIGHFLHDNPQRSARRTRQVVDFLHARYVSSRYLVLTDHLYNDMPRNFKHAWRTAAEKEARDHEIESVLSASWARESWPALLGDLVATVVGEAVDDRITPCINFDGEHVDIDIAKRTLEVIGSERLIALTDHTETLTMAGVTLRMDPTSGLLMDPDDVVAAGTSDDAAQRALMTSAGFSERDINNVFFRTPLATLQFQVQSRGSIA